MSQQSQRYNKAFGGSGAIIYRLGLSNSLIEKSKTLFKDLNTPLFLTKGPLFDESVKQTSAWNSSN